MDFIYNLLDKMSMMLMEIPTIAAMGLLLAAGVLTSLTPCNLSAIPITVGVLSNDVQENSLNGLIVALAYSLGSSLILILTGVFSSNIGVKMAAYGNEFNLLLGFVVIAMSLQMINVIDLRNSPDILDKLFKILIGLPALAIVFKAVKTRDRSAILLFLLLLFIYLFYLLYKNTIGKKGKLNNSNNNLFRYIGVFITGALMGLFSSPCATPVLIALISLSSRLSLAKTISLFISFSIGYNLLMIVAGVASEKVWDMAGNESMQRASLLIQKVIAFIMLIIGALITLSVVV